MADKRIMQMRDRQQRVFRIASDPTRYGLTLKLIAADSGLHYDSVRAYAAGETTMPMNAFSALIDVIPDELLSYLVGKDRAIVRVPDAIDHDEIEDACRDYLETKGRAHHKNSPGGREVSLGLQRNRSRDRGLASARMDARRLLRDREVPACCAGTSLPRRALPWGFHHNRSR